MGRYTILTDPAVDDYIQGHLDRIVDAVVELMGTDLEAVVLTGGFGRGEGSIRRDGGRFHVVNDYDIEVNYRERLGGFCSKLVAHFRYEKAVRDIADRLAMDCGIKQIDLVLKGGSCYSDGGSPTLAVYDKKYGSQLLYGAKNPIDNVPEYQPSDIPLFEGTWLLRNRAVGLLLANLYIKNGVVADGKKEYFGVELNKAVLAMGDALLILLGKYHVSYAERARSLPGSLLDAPPFMSRLVDMYRLAVSYKLSPDGVAFADADPLDIWSEVTRLYCDLFVFYEGRRLNMPFLSVVDYLEWAGRQPSAVSKHLPRLVYYKLGGAIPTEARQLAALKVDRFRGVAFAIGLLEARMNAGGTSEYMAALKKLAASAYGGSNVGHDWLRLARSYLLMAHPKGELRRALR